MDTKKLLVRLVPATFLAGAVFGLGVTQIAAAIRGSAVFSDVPSSHYADEAIGEMYSLGIIKGMDSTHFAPNEPLTRGQAALLFKRLRDNLNGTVSSSSSSKSSSSSSSSSVSSSSSSSSSSSVSSSSSSTSYGSTGVRFDSSGYNVDKNIATGLVTIAIVRIGGTRDGGGTVEYSFSGGTAVAGQDYTPLSGTLSFQGTTTSQKLQVQIKNNTATSGTHTVKLVLKNPTGGLRLADPATATLNINDPNSPSSSSSSGTASSSSSSAPTTVGFGATGYMVDEKGGSLTISVIRSGIVTGITSVNYSTSNGTAQAGADYTATNGTFTFAPGETAKTVSIGINNNSAIDGGRSFTLYLTNPSGGALTTSSAPVAINDDDSITLGSGSLKFSSASYTTSMSQGSVAITVNHVLGTGPVSVSYATNGGSAAQGVDYTAVSGTLNFAANEASKTFTIPILNNSSSLGGKTITLTINSPTNGVGFTDPSSATVTINL